MMEPFTAVYSNKNIIIPNQSEADNLYQNGYGYRKNKTHRLWGVEALYNLERRKISVIDAETNRKICFQELFRLLSLDEPELWINFIVYKDLRFRGFIIDVSNHYYRIYERGDYKTKRVSYQLKIISEGKPVTILKILGELEKIERESLSMKVAVVDRRGEIVYYGVNQRDL